MAIDVQEMFDSRVDKYGATQENEEFIQDFFYAIKRVCYDLESPKVGLTVATVPTDFDTDIDVDEKFWSAVSHGIDVYLHDTGRWGHADEDKLLRDYNIYLGRAHTEVMTDAATAETLYTRLGRTS